MPSKIILAWWEYFHQVTVWENCWTNVRPCLLLCSWYASKPVQKSSIDVILSSWMYGRLSEELYTRLHTLKSSQNCSGRMSCIFQNSEFIVLRFGRCKFSLAKNKLSYLGSVSLRATHTVSLIYGDDPKIGCRGDHWYSYHPVAHRAAFIHLSAGTMSEIVSLCADIQSELIWTVGIFLSGLVFLESILLMGWFSVE